MEERKEFNLDNIKDDLDEILSRALSTIMSVVKIINIKDSKLARYAAAQESIKLLSIVWIDISDIKKKINLLKQ